MTVNKSRKLRNSSTAAASEKGQAATTMEGVPEKFSVTKYRCSYCRKSHSKKSWVVKHMASCAVLPSSKACRTCAQESFVLIPVATESGPAIKHQRVCEGGHRPEGTVLVVGCAHHVASGKGV